jgi:hypothetical protein
MTNKKQFAREHSPDNFKTPLSAADKKNIEIAVKRMLAEYGDTFKKLGQE